MIDFEWYRSFIAIYRTGTVSAAAVQRQMTQPAISQHLAALEHAMGIQLFQRTPRQMIPTEDGKSLYIQVIGAVEQLEQLSDATRLRTPHLPLEVHVGVPREFFYVEGVQRLRSPAEFAYRLHVQLGQTNELVEQLENGQLHAVIATQRLARRTLHFQPLQNEDFVIVSSSDYEIAAEISKNELISWLESQNWIAYASDLPMIRRYWREVFNTRPSFVPFLILPDLLMIQQAVARGLGVSVLPRYLCTEMLRHKQIKILWEPEQPPNNQIYIACLREQVQKPEIQWFMRLFLGDH